MVGERVRSALNRDPIWRRAADRVKDRSSSLRNRPGQAVQHKFPQFENRNFGGAIGVGLVEAGIAVVLESTLGIPFGSDVEVPSTRSTSRGTIYTVNVDAPTENMARARAFLEANTGFTSVLTDLYDVDNVEVLRKRPLRDTYQVELLVED